MRRLCRVLARVDRSGHCQNIYPAISTIVSWLNAAELNYPVEKRLHWSQPTACRYLKKLKLAGIVSTAGFTTMHGTRRRVMHPDRLLFVPRESDNPARVESEKRIKDSELKKMHRSAKTQNHPADETAARSTVAIASRSNSHHNPRRTALEVKPKPEPYTTRLTRFVAIARRNILRETTETPEAVAWILRTLQERALLARTIVRGPAYFETSFHEELAQDVARASKYANSAELIASMSANRHKVACLQLAVEEAGRSGRRAAELLAERFSAASFGAKTPPQTDPESLTGHYAVIPRKCDAAAVADTTDFAPPRSNR